MITDWGLDIRGIFVSCKAVELGVPLCGKVSAPIEGVGAYFCGRFVSWMCSKMAVRGIFGIKRKNLPLLRNDIFGENG